MYVHIRIYIYRNTCIQYDEYQKMNSGMANHARLLSIKPQVPGFQFCIATVLDLFHVGIWSPFLEINNQKPNPCSSWFNQFELKCHGSLMIHPFIIRFMKLWSWWNHHRNQPSRRVSSVWQIALWRVSAAKKSPQLLGLMFCSSQMVNFRCWDSQTLKTTFFFLKKMDCIDDKCCRWNSFWVVTTLSLNQQYVQYYICIYIYVYMCGTYVFV